MKAKRRIHEFRFDQPFMQSGAKTHVALVDAAANLTEVLVMKAKEVYTENSQSVSSYDEDGTYERTRVSNNTRDYGGEYIFVTEELVHIVEKQVKVR